MLLLDILEQSIKTMASDIHISCGTKTVLRINKQFICLDNFKVPDKSDIVEMFNYFVSDNSALEQIYIDKRRVDTAIYYNAYRFRVNISSSEGVPCFTLRMVNNKLKSFIELGLPDVITKLVNLNQGLILVTGKANSGKSTTLNTLINDINQNQAKKIITLENPIEYKHLSAKSLIIQKEVGLGYDVNTFTEGVQNSLREDPDILVIGEIRDQPTMDAAIEMAEAGHLVIGTLHTKSCAETIDRIINFYDLKEQINIKYMLSTILKAVISQRLIRGVSDKLVLVPEVMIVDNVVAACIRKEKFSVSEIDDAIQSGVEKGNVSLIHSLAKLYVEEKLTLDQIKEHIDEKSIDTLNRTIMQLKLRR